MNSTKILGVFVVLVLALYFRLGVISNTEIDMPIRVDASEYYNYAYNLKNFSIYSRTSPGSSKIEPDAFRTPGYAIFIMPFIEWPPTDKMLLNINLIQAVLSIFTVLVVWLIYNKVVPTWYALIVALLAAVSPHLISFTTYLLTETLFTFLVAISFWFIVIATGRKSLCLFFLSGVLLAFCALTRPTLNYFIIIVCIYLFFQCRNFKYVVFLFLGFILIFSPWMFRNTTVNDNYQSLAVSTVHHGMYPDFMYQNLQESKGFPYRFDPKSKEFAINTEALINELKRRFKEETWVHVKWFLVGKPLTLFSWNILNGWGDIYIYPVKKSPYFYNDIFKFSHKAMLWAHWPLIFLSFCGCFVCWAPGFSKRMTTDTLIILRLASLLVFYFLLLHIVAAPFPRYSVPIRPFNYGMALFFMYYVATKIKRSR